jgi:cytochrome c oxidase subunit II
MEIYTDFQGGVSQVAGQVDGLFLFITLTGLVFFLITQGFLIYFAWRYRRSRQLGIDTPAITGNHLLEAVWIVIPSLVVLAIFIYGYLVYKNIRTPPPGAMEIQVTARQWLYRFTYPDGRKTLNEVRVEVGKPVKFLMKSDDVIHGFYLPAFRVKQDILPGSYTYLWVKPEKTGRYEIFCTQFCGTGHSTMRAVLLVVSHEDFKHWHDQEEKPETLSPVKHGEELVEHSGCLGCHSLDGTVKVGPTLKGLSGRTVTLTDGKTVSSDENYLRESLIDPNAKVVKGYPPIMPTFKGVLKDEEISAVIAYIKTVK